MGKKREACTTDANPATPWKGRLRSRHATPPTLPSSYSTRNHKREQDAAQSFNKRAASNKAGKCRSRSVEKRPQQSAPPRRSPRLAGNHPAFVDRVCKSSAVY
uniref:Uncharacterized protein n=1 Tax=Leersia perrieri TaxID=77586 RepID=A0A0D9XWE8_9ORYZ